MMNNKAKELGLKDTHFLTPHGLDKDEHYTTAYELAVIADYALDIEKIKEVVSTKTYTVTLNGYPRLLTNTHELLGNLDGVYGVKTGFTNKAGRCLVTASKRNDFDIITVVLGSDTKNIRTKDSVLLLEYAYDNYEHVDIKKKIEEEFTKWKEKNEKSIYINKGIKNEISVKLEESKYEIYPFKKDRISDIQVEINSINYLEAPIKEDMIIGNLKLSLDGKIIENINIKTSEEIKKKEIMDYFHEIIKDYDIILEKCIN